MQMMELFSSVGYNITLATIRNSTGDANSLFHRFVPYELLELDIPPPLHGSWVNVKKLERFVDKSILKRYNPSIIFIYHSYDTSSISRLIVKRALECNPSIPIMTALEANDISPIEWLNPYLQMTGKTKPIGRDAVRFFYTNETKNDERWYIQNSDLVILNNNEKFKRIKFEMPEQQQKLRILRQMTWTESIQRRLGLRNSTYVGQLKQKSGHLSRRNFVFLGAGNHEINYQVVTYLAKVPPGLIFPAILNVIDI